MSQAVGGAEQSRGVTVTSPTIARHSPSVSTYGSCISTTTTTSPNLRSSNVRNSPERIRRNSSGFLIPVPEEDGSMDFNENSQPVSHPVMVDTSENDDEEVEEWLLEQGLAREGLYRGSYKRLIAIYTLTPLSTILAFGLLSSFPLVVYPLNPKLPHSPYPYAPYLPYPLPELLTAAALWSMSLLLRDFVFSLSSSISTSLSSYASAALSLLATTLQTLISVFLQLTAIALLLITRTQGIKHPTWHDHTFRRVWTVALGWAGAEAIVGIKQGYENIALYRDVLVTVKKIHVDDISPPLTRVTTRESQELSYSEDENSHRMSSTIRGERQPLLSMKPQQPYRSSKSALEQEVQDDLDQLVALKSREELEEIYGVPVIEIPVFVSCLHRINAVLNSLGTFLLLSAAYLRSPLAPSTPKHTPSFSSLIILPTALRDTLAKNSHKLLGVTVAGVIFCQLTLALLHTAWVLPKIGVPTYVYIELLFSLALFFSGLAFWEALV